MDISKQDLIDILNNLPNSPFVYVVMRTPVSMNKGGREHTNQYYGKVFKTSRGNFYLGGNYQDRVNSQLKKEGKEPNFVSEPPSGKYHVSRCVLKDLKTDSVEYLQLEYFTEVPPISVEYDYEGDSIEKQLFEDYLVKRTKPVKQGTDRPVNIMTPKFDNILELHFNGEEYKVIHEEVEVEV